MNYETIFVVSPALAEEERTALVDKVKSTITENEGQISHFHDWGKRKFGYEVKKQTHGLYFLAFHTGPASILEKLRLQFRYADGILKFQTIKIEDIEVENKRFLDLQEAAASAKAAASKGGAPKKEAPKPKETTETEEA